jgi:hypothetical protein
MGRYVASLVSTSRRTKARTRRLFPRAWALCCVVGAGCASPSGGGSSGGACAETSACGGDVAGTWQFDSACLSIAPPFAEAACQDAVRQSSITVSGTVAYTPSASDPNSGTQEVDATYSFVIDEVYSDACLKALQFRGASAQACAALQSYFAGPYALACAPLADTCDCTFSDRETVHQSEPYSIQGMQIVVASSGAGFCRAGDVLVVSSDVDGSVSRQTLHRIIP